MKNMAGAKEFWQAPPEGKYPSTITEVEAKLSNKGSTMLALTLQIDEPEQYRGETAYDYIITDGSAKGGGMGKAKLRGLGVNVDANIEVPDEQLAAQLRGQKVLVVYGNEPQMTQSFEGGPYDKVRTAIDPSTGQEVQINKLVVKGYSRHNFAQPVHAAPQPQQQIAQAPQQQFVAQAPQQFAQAPAPQAQFAPQGYDPATGQPLMQGYAPPQFAQAPQQAFAPNPGYAAPQPAFAPAAAQPQQAFAPAPGAPAQVPWAAAPGPNGAPAAQQAPAEADGGKKKGGRKLNVQDA